MPNYLPTYGTALLHCTAIPRPVSPPLVSSLSCSVQSLVVSHPRPAVAKRPTSPYKSQF